MTPQLTYISIAFCSPVKLANPLNVEPRHELLPDLWTEPIAIGNPYPVVSICRLVGLRQKVAADLTYVLGGLNTFHTHKMSF